MALAHGMIVVTRNVGDFIAMGVPLLNPWEGAT
jgi:toxin FitB